MKKPFIYIILVLVSTAAVLFIINRDGDDVVGNSISTPASISSKAKFTKGEVAKHSVKNDCWTIIDNKVYNITSYIPRHPGGENILSACGTDGTAFFDGEQAGKLGNAENHRGGKAESQLAQLLIGELSE